MPSNTMTNWLPLIVSFLATTAANTSSEPVLSSIELNCDQGDPRAPNRLGATPPSLGVSPEIGVDVDSGGQNNSSRPCKRSRECIERYKNPSFRCREGACVEVICKKEADCASDECCLEGHCVEVPPVNKVAAPVAA